MKLQKRYESIPNLYRKEAQSIWMLPEVIVQEKLDGTNCSFGYMDGMPVMNSRNNNIWHVKGDVTNHVSDFDGFGIVNTFLSHNHNFFSELKSIHPDKNILIFGEFYGKGIMNRVDYGQGKHFTFFDAYDLDLQQWLIWDDFNKLCKDLGLDIAPVLCTGAPKLSVFERLLKINSPQGQINGVPEDQENLMEGIVVKGLYSQKDRFGERIITKFKVGKFAEIKEKKEKKVDKQDAKRYDLSLEIAEKYMTEGRLENILEKLRLDNLPISIKITGELIRRVQQDVLDDLSDEEKQHKDFNEKFIKKSVGSICSQLFNQYLKNEFEKSIREENV